jgi:LysM repeat protein
LKILIITKLMLALLLCGGLAQAQSLRGSSTSIENQYRTALAYGYTFVKSAHSVQQHVNPGQLVRVNPDRNLELHDVSYPYAIPGTKLFLNRLSAQYQNACGEKLTVTSLLRPRDRQPANSVARSVHPTGMAIDLRVPSTHKCRSWLESTLLSLEKERVLDVTRERRPPHYHVAVFVKSYEARLAAQSGSGYDYVVHGGDTLSGIAARTGISVAQLRATNGLRGHLINVGQELQIPARGTVAATTGSNDVAALNELTHRVNRGDTLWDIANRYGISVEQLRLANRQAKDTLQIGQVLKVFKS